MRASWFCGTLWAPSLGVRISFANAALRRGSGQAGILARLRVSRARLHAYASLSAFAQTLRRTRALPLLARRSRSSGEDGRLRIRLWRTELRTPVCHTASACGMPCRLAEGPWVLLTFMGSSAESVGTQAMPILCSILAFNALHTPGARRRMGIARCQSHDTGPVGRTKKDLPRRPRLWRGKHGGTEKICHCLTPLFLPRRCCANLAQGVDLLDSSSTYRRFRPVPNSRNTG